MAIIQSLDHKKNHRSLIERAESLLFHIETRVARHAARSHHGLHHFISDHSVRRDRQATLNAHARGERSPIRPTIQQMERFADEWGRFVPRDSTVCAAIARRLGQDYIFSLTAVPRIRAALGLDDDAVKQAYVQLFAQPIEQVYATGLSPLDRLNWRWSGLAHKLESLPPFWIAYALTLTETVGATILALPIAIAGIGPLPGVVLLIILGFVNMLTIGFMSEAVARSGAIRYGTGFIGQVVADYLGGLGSLILTFALFGICILVLLSYYIGLSSALEGLTRIPSILWAGILFLFALYFLRRDSLNATIASALVVGTVNIAIIIGLSAFALTQFQPANLMQMELPFISGHPLEPSALGVVFGVILTAYFGHLSVSNCGKLVLHRDPSGRSLIWGNIAAQATAILLYSVFVVAVAGVVSPQQLVSQSGTSLEPFAAKMGPIAYIFGSIYVVLGIGMASIHYSLGLFNLVHERLPLASHTSDIDSQRSGVVASSSIGIGRALHPLVFALRRGRARFLIEISPIIFVFCLAEWSLFSHALSFTSLLSFLGIIFVSLLAGIFPVLLIAASRKKGEYTPRAVYRLLGNPILLTAIYLLFCASLLVHGLVLWQDPVRRALALSAACLVVGVTCIMIRRGIFAPRLIVELREDLDPTKAGALALMAGGRPVSADVRFGYADTAPSRPLTGAEFPILASLRSVSMQLPSVDYREIKVWTHRITAEGDSEPLPAHMTLQCTDGGPRDDVALRNGVILLPRRTGDCSLTVRLADSPAVETGQEQEPHIAV